ncbi:MAG: YigZ family protein [Bacteroidota bacterium]
MEQASLFRLTAPSEGFFKDRGSKFYAFCFPVRELEEVEEFLKSVKKKYHDARHHCFAYRLGKQAQIEFATDDGEPSHSAGDPILGALKSAQLSWTLAIVVRYFGGTKLGIRGLIEAYRSATENALQEGQVEEIIPKIRFVLEYAYDKTSAINKILHPFPLNEVESVYTDLCRQTFSIRQEVFPALAERLKNSGFSIEKMEESE